MPRFSFVIPTRDRPQFIKRTIQSMLNQTFDDFEIIICDNPINAPCDREVASFSDSRIHYYQNEEPLPLNDNWEKAMSYASGEYKGIFLDKALLQPYCLELCNNLISHNSGLDIISWPRESYYPDNENLYETGRYTPQYVPQKPVYFGPYEEWQRRLAFKTLRDAPDDLFHRGKIVFGFYSQALIDRIYKKTDRLFPPFFPDYTSLSYALALANEAVDLMKPMILGVQPTISTGLSLNQKEGFLKEFLFSFEKTEEICKELPHPGIYTSQHNVVARDYQIAKKNLNVLPPNLNETGLARCIIYDLEKAPFSSEKTRQRQIKKIIDKTGVVINTNQSKPSSFKKLNFLAKLNNIIKRLVKIWPSLTLNNQFSTIDQALMAQARFYKYTLISKIYKFIENLKYN